MPTGMKLFVLRKGEGGPIINDVNGNPLYFTSKATAKIRRDDLRGKGELAIVSPGPDHRNFSANTGRITNAL